MFSETGSLIICGDLNARTDVFKFYYLSEDEVLTNEWLNSLNFDQEYYNLNQLKLPKRWSFWSWQSKFILGIKQSTADKAVYGELGRRPFHEDISGNK